MPREINIDLDVDQVGPHDRREDVARLVMVRACGFTRDGGTPTITKDCNDYRALEGEAQRLKAEVDDALARARAHFERSQAADVALQARARAGRTTAAAKPHIETGLKVGDVMTRNVRTLNRNDRLSSPTSS